MRQDDSVRLGCGDCSRHWVWGDGQPQGPAQVEAEILPELTPGVDAEARLAEQPSPALSQPRDSEPAGSNNGSQKRQMQEGLIVPPPGDKPRAERDDREAGYGRRADFAPSPRVVEPNGDEPNAGEYPSKKSDPASRRRAEPCD